jgi:S1-C subfamily serine protease
MTGSAREPVCSQTLTRQPSPMVTHLDIAPRVARFRRPAKTVSAMTDQDWKIPPQLQPALERYPFDLDETLRAIVGVKAQIAEDAFTAGTLGTQRSGSGIVIQPHGIILTVGYLVTEAASVWLTLPDGKVLSADVLGIDQASGFALLQALGPLDLPTMEIGNSQSVSDGDPAVLAAWGGRHHAVETRIVAREPFAGYWEYLLDAALFTAPAHPFWGGAALIGLDGKLLGCGSLMVQQGDPGGRPLDINMVIPIEELAPVFDKLLRGGIDLPERPWIGIFCIENDGGLSVQGVAADGPADIAGVRAGDRLQNVGGQEVAGLAELWRAIWESGPPGEELNLVVLRGRRFLEISVTTAVRNSFLKAPRVH